MRKKVCKKCKYFVEGNECPICKGNQFSTNWQGRLYILDANKSMIANKVGIEAKGEYAIKVRLDSMELKISQKKEEPLMSRTRLEGEVMFDKATPSTKEIRSNIAKSIGKDESLVDIKGIYNQYGQKKAKIVCYAYENKDVLKKIKIEGKKAKEKAGKAVKQQEGAEAKEEKAETKEAKQEKAEEKKSEHKAKETEAEKKE